MILAIASGKGGTGKTTFAVNLAHTSPHPVQLLDCDVEEPNANLFLKAPVREKRNITSRVPELIPEGCSCCGKCAAFCQFNALACIREKLLIYEELCHACGGCIKLCPEKALREKIKIIGELEFAAIGKISLVTGRSRIGNPLSTPVIREVKRQMDFKKDIIIDSPPGTACAAIESVKNSDLTLLVAESTPFGLHDLKLTVEVLKEIKIPAAVVINRADSGDSSVRDYCQLERIPLLSEFPYDRRVAEAYSHGQLTVETIDEYRQLYKDLWSRIRKLYVSNK